MQAKTRIDIQCNCKTCGLVFTLHGLDQQVEAGGGFALSSMKCPSCEQSSFIFYMHKILDENRFVENHLALVKDGKFDKLVKIPRLGAWPKNDRA